jgi:hypothetical protein
LYKINQKPNDKCSFWLEEVETIEHIFWSCNKISKLWEDLNNCFYFKNWTRTAIKIDYNFIWNNRQIYEKKKKKKNCMRNLIILLTKFYLYRTKWNTEQVQLKALQSSNTNIASKVAFLHWIHLSKNRQSWKAHTWCWHLFRCMI